MSDNLLVLNVLSCQWNARWTYSLNKKKDVKIGNDFGNSFGKLILLVRKNRWLSVTIEILNDRFN